jgi:hypothetical protein
MEKKTRKKKWGACPDCAQLVYAAVGTLGNHVCPEKLIARKEAELDIVIDAELSTWDADVKKFWRSKDVKFYQHLLKEEK